MSAIDDVKSRIDIVDLVGEYVSLKRAGRSFKANCPFHAEKTPSFIVSPERQTWHCFGACGTGGDVFNFVMKREDVEFGEALRILAERVGVTIGRGGAPQEDERLRRIVQTNEAAAAYFHHTLLNAKAARDARAYLDGRGLDAETIEAFQLGYSQESWDALKTHLIARDFTQEELLAAGLVIEGDRGPYDRFRGRLMFPIRDERGRVVGFGARALASEGDSGSAASAKFINTPQTPAFNKSELLYALDRAKEAIRREKSVVVVEGYMDVIAAHQHGIDNVVASMGTALTERQIRTLDRFRAKVLLAMDADAAGIEATLHAIQEGQATGAVRAEPASAHPSELDDQEFSARVQEWSRDALKRAAVTFWVMPLSGKDPDEMIRADRAAWGVAVEQAKPFTEHIFGIVAGRRDRSQPDERAKLLQELLPVLRLIDEPVNRAHYVQRLARLAQVDEETVLRELGRPQSPPRRQTQAADVAATVARPLDGPEEFCLALLLRRAELRPEGRVLSPDVFLHAEHQAILAAWRETEDMDALRDRLPVELHPQLQRVLGRDLPLYEGQPLHDAFQDCVVGLESHRLSAAKDDSMAALAELDAQKHMRSGVKGAYAADQSEDGGDNVPAEDDAPSLEYATALLDDKERGLRLHARERRRSEKREPEPPRGEDAP